MADMKKVKISDICNIEKGTTGLATAIPGIYPLVATGAERKTCSTYQFDSKAVCIPLVSSTGHGSKTLNYVHYQEGKFALGSILATIIPKDENTISAKYLHAYLQKNKDTVLVPLMKGAANVSLSIHDVANIEIPCPPLVVQAKILEKIDIFSGKYLIFLKENDIQLNLLNNLLNTILQEAIRGTFTSKWRKQHPELICGDNHASQLFVKIQKEKGQLIKEGKINKEKRLSPIIEKEKPFDLPQGWIWCRLGNISEWRYGKSLVKTQYKSNGKYPVFGSNGIVGYFDKYLTSKPSIVIGRKGSAGALNKSEMPSWTTDVAFYIEESKFINFVYLFILLKSLKIDSIGKGIKPGINRNEAYNLLVPLAPANEQKAIVEKVTKIMFLIDQLEKQIAERKELSEMLVQAVLREAFEAN